MLHSIVQKGKKTAILLFVSLFIWFIIHTTLIVLDGLTDKLDFVDVAVVLGNKVELDGKPSARLQARLDKASELYSKGYFNYIIVSGGIGKENYDEAKVMKQYLVNHGVPEQIIIEDNNGYNSYMTAENTKVILEKLNAKSVMIISQYFHISRTSLAFSKVGIENVATAHADFFELRDIYSTLREFPAYYKYILK